MQNISFFIPAYNCAATIAESVASIINTNFLDGDELIIVNDCSTDDTATVLATLQKTNAFITVINHTRNKGGAAARNTAIEDSKNSLLFCLDSDNVLAENSITPLKQYLISSKADGASFQFQYFFSTNKSTPDYIWTLPDGENSINSYITGENTPGQHGNYLFTKQSWLNAKGYAEGTGALDTWTFGLRQAITGTKMVVLKDSFYYHRLDNKNSYWMLDAEQNISSVSLKVTFALFPFFDMIDEKFLSYMLGEGKYSWFYQLKKNPLKLVPKGSKADFYKKTNQEVLAIAYKKQSWIKAKYNAVKRRLS